MAILGLKSSHHNEADDRPLIDENLRGIIIVVLGSIALVGAAYGAMVALTGPDGWATRMANTAVGEPGVAAGSEVE